MRRLILVALVLVACKSSPVGGGGNDLSAGGNGGGGGTGGSGGGGGFADLAGVAPNDLSSFGPRPDLAGVDLGGFCLGTAVAGTCVQAFFAPLAACFSPSGACHQASPPPTTCWQDGASLVTTVGLESSRRDYKSGATTCFTELTTQVITVGPAYSDGTNTLRLNSGTGAYQCPDGSTGSIGASFGGCSALQQLLMPDTAACTMGACPF